MHKHTVSDATVTPLSTVEPPTAPAAYHHSARDVSASRLF